MIEANVGIIHADAPVPSTADWRLVSPELQFLINRGLVTRILPGESASMKALIVRDPSALQFLPRSFSNLTPSRTLIVADEDGPGKSYDPRVVSTTAARYFGNEFAWCALEGSMTERMGRLLGEKLLRVEYPLVVDASRLNLLRKPPLPGRLLIGRTASGAVSDWPGPKDLSLAYPSDGPAEVRVLGDCAGALVTMDWKDLPAAWVEYPSGSIAPSIFWRSVDCLVHFDRAARTGIREDFLDAMVAGAVVIARTESAHLLSSGVVKAEPADALGIVDEITHIASFRERQIDVGRQLVRDRFATGRLVDFMHSFLLEGSEVHE